jgi:U3 small nucleolar RNA-associated protein 18
MEKWVDEEDQNIKINLNNKNNLKKLKKAGEDGLVSGAEFQERLREYFTKINTHADIYKWADNETEEESNFETGNLLKTNTNIVEDFKNDNILKITQLGDMNKKDYHSSIITSIEFSNIHDDLCLTAGFDKKLRIFKINEKAEHTVSHSINTIDLPISSAKFAGDEVIVSGKRKHYFVFNLEKGTMDRGIGNYTMEKLFVGKHYFAFGTSTGYVHLYDVKSKLPKFDLKINGSVNSVCFDRNDTYLYTVGDQSEIYVFDLRNSRRCVNKINDSGNFNTTYMDISPDGSYIATGANSGHVNLYTTDQIRDGNINVEPIKTVENLTTSCEFLRFSKTSNKLGICSRWKKHAFKLVFFF